MASGIDGIGAANSTLPGVPRANARLSREVSPAQPQGQSNIGEQTQQLIEERRAEITEDITNRAVKRVTDNIATGITNRLVDEIA